MLLLDFSSFEAFVEGQEVLLRWETQTESQNAGFEIQQATEANPSFQTIAFVEGAGVSSTPREYTYNLGPLAPENYRFRLKQIDFDGTITYSPTVEVTIISTQPLHLQTYYRSGQYITLILSGNHDQTVHLTLYDLLGRKVKTLFSGLLTGEHPLTLSLSAASLAPGLYFLNVQGDEHSYTKQLIIY